MRSFSEEKHIIQAMPTRANKKEKKKYRPAIVELAGAASQPATQYYGIPP